jgi:hypothetical protein
MEKITQDPTIRAFFDARPGMDPVAAIRWLLELYESFESKVSNGRGCNGVDDEANVSARITEMMTMMSEIKTAVDPLVSNLETKISGRLFDMQREYTEGIRRILTCHTQEQMTPMMEKLHLHLSDRLRALMSELPGKTQEQFHSLEKTLVSLRHETDLSRIERVFQDTMASVSLRVNAAAESQNTMLGEMRGYFTKLTHNSSSKGASGETQLNDVLTRMFPAAEIINTSRQVAACDFLMRRNEGRADILFENKSYASNVPKEEVIKFVRDATVQQQHAIFLSQHTGISTKTNYQVDLHQGKVLVFVHNVQYQPEKIQIAVDLIDTLSGKLAELEAAAAADAENEVTKSLHRISKSELDQIYHEMESFATQRGRLISTMTENHKSAIAQIQEMKFPALELYLSTKYSAAAASASGATSSVAAAVGTKRPRRELPPSIGHGEPDVDANFQCDYCQAYKTEKRRNLMAHYKRCKYVQTSQVDATTVISSCI